VPTGGGLSSAGRVERLQPRCVPFGTGLQVIASILFAGKPCSVELLLLAIAVGSNFEQPFSGMRKCQFECRGDPFPLPSENQDFP